MQLIRARRKPGNRGFLFVSVHMKTIENGDIGNRTKTFARFRDLLTVPSPVASSHRRGRRPCRPPGRL